MSDAAPSGGADHERAEFLFAQAVSLPAERRTSFLAEACGRNVELRAELLSLLEHAESGERFLERLAELMGPPVLPPGSRAGHYEILDCIGAGGMGAVYRAHDTRLARDVALKFVPPHLQLTAGADGRLHFEARAAAALEHVNVCTVHEIGETDDGQPFIAMALYQGETLKERLARGPLSSKEAVNIVVQVTRGLWAAHAHGIVHRDVKPGNIMLTPGGIVKLLDFGLAAVPEPSLPLRATPGTVPYMSPEQTRGEAVGPTSDLWSVGVVLYEMLAGVRPFRGTDYRSIRQAVLHSTPEPLRNLAPQVPASLQRIVDRLLQKHPGSRYQSADALLHDLTRALPTRRPRLRDAAARDRLAVIAALFALAMGGPGAWLRLRDDRPAPAPAAALETSRVKTIAVLPFVSYTDNTDEDYLSDGLASELVGALSSVQSVRVIARASALSFRDERRDVREIGRALKVSAVLAGSLQSAGDSLRVRAELVDVASGVILWSQTYAQSLADILDVQRDLALRIARALEAGLSATERARLGRPATASAAAFALYLKGRYFWNQRTRAGFDRAIEYFQNAIAIDSQYAAAYAGLAAVYSLQGLAGWLQPAEAGARMRAAALRALALDDGLAEAHAVMGAYFHVYGWDSAAAEREQLRAIELDPNYATAHHYYGNLLAALGRLEEAIVHKRRALELDALVPALSESLAGTLLRTGDTGQALELVYDALELDSTYWRAHAVLGLIHESQHRFDEAIEAYERANQLAGTASHRMTSDLARAFARAGRTDEARQLVRALRQHAVRSGDYDPIAATALRALGDSPGAYEWLEQSFRQRHPQLRLISTGPRFLPFQSDSQFLNLMRRVGLPVKADPRPEARTLRSTARIGN